MTSREMFHQMLNSRSNPERAYKLLSGMAAAASAADSLPDSLTSEERVAKLTDRLNACKNPRKVYAAAMALAPIIRKIV